MKNLKSIALVAFATAFGFSSCSNSDDVVNQETEQRTVFFKLNKNASGSRAVGPHVDGGEVTFSNGYLCLVDANGKIHESVKINSGDGEFDSSTNPKTIGITKLTTDGVVLDNVDAKVTKAHVVGNMTVEGTPDNIKEVLATAVTVENQYDIATKGVEKVALHGEGVLEPSTEAGFDYKVQVDVYAVTSRLELGTITAKGAVNDFKVTGIFLNNYYSTMGVNGAVESNNLKDNGQDPDNYKDGAGSYITANGIMHDYNINGLGVLEDLVCWPEDGKNIDNKVWGYNFLVSNAEKPVSPKVVIRLEGVKVGEAEAATIPYFLTISTLKDGDESLVIQKGYAYRIKDIEFDEGDLHLKPFETEKSVKVDVTLMEWNSKDIGYELD